MLVVRGNSVEAQSNDLTRVVPCIYTQTYNDELRGDIRRSPVIAQILALRVACGSPGTAPIIDMTTVDLWQRNAVFQVVGRA